MKQLTYPSARAINVSYDSVGRLSGLAEGGNGPTWLSSVTYNVAGQVTGNALGNGVIEVFGYDANRMQLISQKAGTASPYTNRMNLTYGYQATVGQMGSGTTAGNSGQVMSISGTINGTTESAAHTYDNLGRLVTSNQTSNSSSAQRRLAYDRWGNRTGMWDATSGGSQIQSISLGGSGGIATNQIQSVTIPEKDPFSYTYDAGGNVTNDGIQDYGYDSENRLVSVDGGSTASYAYDQHNRRYKKTIGSTVTHYVWQGSQVLAEHNGSTGAVVTDYIFLGSRMIAKVSSGSTGYFLGDRLSVRMTLDGSGNVSGRQAHLPFGEDFAESGSQDKHHFTSYDRDTESGTDYAINRQYYHSVGRFNRPDPLGASARKNAPQSWNRYSYVRNLVIDKVDPDGLIAANPCPGMSPGECLCATIPEACSGTHGELLDGGGPGGGETPQRVPLFGDNLAKYQIERGRLIKLLKDPESDCAKYLLARLGLSGSRVARSVRAQRAFDGLLSTINTVLAGIQPSNGLFHEDSVAKFFADTAAEAAQAFYADPSDQGATIFDVYYAPSGLYAGAILHETLHYFLGIGDEQLAARLGVDTSQGTRAISWAFRDAGCR